MEEVNVTTQNIEETAPAQNIEETAPAESMADYAGEIDSSMREISVGDILEGTVVGLTDTEVTVDLQYAAEGIIRTQDYSGDPSFSVKENVHPGDVVKATVLKLDLAWDNFKTLMDEKTAVDVTVKEAVKGGVVAFLNGVRAFIPASKLALEYVEDLSTFVGETVPVYVIQAEKEGKRLVLSSRDVLRDRRAAEKANMISNLKVGLVTEGTVESLQTYGAFVGLGNGIDGLVHISQITNTKRLKHPKEMLSVGDKVKVKVTGIKDGKISLSMKACEETTEAPRRVEEEHVQIPKAEKLTTSLGSLLKGIKLD